MGIDINELKPNSHAYKAQEKTTPPAEKKVQKVINGKVKVKQNNGRKLADIFVAEDISNVKSYVVMDILIPAAKKLISDVVRDGIDMILYGSSGGSKRSSSSSNYVSYRSYSDRDRREEPRYSGGSKSQFDYLDYEFTSRGDAEAVLKHMTNIIRDYGIATVADFYDLVDLTPPYTSNRYGWTNLDRAEVAHSRSGWIIKLPKAMVID